MPLRRRKQLSLQIRKMDGGFPCQQFDRRRPAQKGDLHRAAEQDLVNRNMTWMEESASRDGEKDAAVRGGVAPLLELEDRNGLDRG